MAHEDRRLEESTIADCRITDPETRVPGLVARAPNHSLNPKCQSVVTTISRRE
jgi:hypothetical protein